MSNNTATSHNTAPSDFAERVVGHIDSRRPRPSKKARIVLAALAVAQGAIALPWIFGTNLLRSWFSGVRIEHLTRDGALGVALAAIGLSVAWRPRYAYAMLGPSLVLGFVQLLASVRDTWGHHAHSDFELSHIPEAGELVLIVAIALTPWLRRFIRSYGLRLTSPASTRRRRPW